MLLEAGECFLVDRATECVYLDEQQRRPPNELPLLMPIGMLRKGELDRVRHPARLMRATCRGALHFRDVLCLIKSKETKREQFETTRLHHHGCKADEAP